MSKQYDNPMNNLFPVSDNAAIRATQAAADRKAIVTRYRDMVKRSLHAAICGGLSPRALDALQAEIRNYEKSYPQLVR